jgi:hypothetical protein
MPDIELDETALADFQQKLDQLKASLTEEQLELLEAILTIAWNATEHEGEIHNGFKWSFTPQQASLLRVYHHTPLGVPVSATTRLIRHTSTP